MISEFPNQPVLRDTPQVGALRALLFHCWIGDKKAFMLYLLIKEPNGIIVAAFPFRR